MDRIILLKPRGRPNPGMRWADDMPHGYILMNEDAHCWYGKPVEDPVAEILTLPKFAWEVADEETTLSREVDVSAAFIEPLL